MGQNTKCPLHGNEHPDFACPDKEKTRKIVAFLDSQTTKLLFEVLEDLFGKDDAAVWLNSPHRALGGRSPQYFIDGGREDIVSDLVCDMLTGNYI